MTRGEDLCRRHVHERYLNIISINTRVRQRGEIIENLLELEKVIKSKKQLK